MTNLVPPLNQTLPETGGVSGGLTTEVENPSASWAGLNLGQQITVRINPQSLQALSGKILVSLDLSVGNVGTDSQPPAVAEIKLPPQMKLPENAAEMQLRITAKTPQRLDLRILSVDGRKAESFVIAPETAPAGKTMSGPPTAAAALVKTVTEPQNLPLAPLRLQPLLARELLSAGIDPANLRRISAVIENLGVKVEVAVLPANLSGTPVPEISADSGTVSAIGRDLAAILKPLFVGEQNNEKYRPAAPGGQPLPQRITGEIEKFFANLDNRSLPAETAQRGERTVLKTPLGEIIPEQPLKIAVGEKLLLRIGGLIGLPAKERVVPAGETAVQPPLGNKMAEILTPLQNKLPPDVYAAVMEKIPANNSKMLSNIMSFLKASGEGRIEHWLGQETVDKMRISGPEGRQALSQLENLIVGRREENAQWRIIEIPFYGAENLSRIKVAVRRFGREEGHRYQGRRQTGAARFVVDTSFTVLGGFQFDGFSLPAEKRFDLIIRTEKEIDNDFCTQIMQLFRTSLSAVDYAGNIRINIKEKFIKLCEDEPEKTILQDGIFI